MGSGSVVRMPPPDYQAATANGSEPSCPPPAYPEVVINIEQGSNDAPAATAATETATEPTYFIQEHSLGSSKCQKCCDRLVVALEKCAAPFVRFRETKIGHPFAIVAIIIGRAFYYFLWIPIACLFWVIGCLIVGLLVFMLYPFAALPLAAARLLYPPAFKEPQGLYYKETAAPPQSESPFPLPSPLTMPAQSPSPPSSTTEETSVGPQPQPQQQPRPRLERQTRSRWLTPLDLYEIDQRSRGQSSTSIPQLRQQQWQADDHHEWDDPWERQDAYDSSTWVRRPASGSSSSSSSPVESQSQSQAQSQTESQLQSEYSLEAAGNYARAAGDDNRCPSRGCRCRVQVPR
ncbi:hypothetical protein BJX76DRAFT_356126 [Aspergillus varians]